MDIKDSLSILVIGHQNSGKTSVINMLTDGIFSVNKCINNKSSTETFRFKAFDRTISVTRLGYNTDDVLQYFSSQRYHHIVIQTKSKGRVSPQDIQLNGLIRNIFSNIPILLIITGCDNNDSSNEQLTRKHLHINNIICLSTLHTNMEYTQYKKNLWDEIFKSFYNNINIYGSNNKLLFNNERIYLKHAVTGLFLNVNNNLTGKYLCLTKDCPKIFVVNVISSDIMQYLITSNQKVQIRCCDSNDQVIRGYNWVGLSNIESCSWIISNDKNTTEDISDENNINSGIFVDKPVIISSEQVDMYLNVSNDWIVCSSNKELFYIVKYKNY